MMNQPYHIDLDKTKLKQLCTIILLLTLLLRKCLHHLAIHSIQPVPSHLALPKQNAPPEACVQVLLLPSHCYLPSSLAPACSQVGNTAEVPLSLTDLILV